MKAILQKIAWLLIKAVGLRWWFAGDADWPSADDWRNPFWRLTEKLAVDPIYALTIIDLRIGYRWKDKPTYIAWPPAVGIAIGQWQIILLKLFYRTQQNFWNAVFSVQLYVVFWKQWENINLKSPIPLLWPKLHLLIRFVHEWWLQIATPGLSHDRGEPHAKLSRQKWDNENFWNPNVNSPDHMEGPT